MAIIVRVCLFVEGRGSRVFFRVSRVHCRVWRVHCLGSLFYIKECMEVSKENSIKLRIACSLFLSLLISVCSVVTRDYDYSCVARLTFCFTWMYSFPVCTHSYRVWSDILKLAKRILFTHRILFSENFLRFLIANWMNTFKSSTDCSHRFLLLCLFSGDTVRSITCRFVIFSCKTQL